MFTRVAYILSIVYLVISFGACKSKAPTSASAPPPAAAQGTTLFLDSFRNAHEKHDLTELARLYCDDGVPHVLRTVSLIEEGRYFALPIAKMSFNTMPKQPIGAVREHGLVMEPNLTQVGELEVEYKATSETLTRYYPVGEKNGAYLIISSTLASDLDAKRGEAEGSRSDRDVKAKDKVSAVPEE